MTTYVLIACSKSKSVDTPVELEWTEDTQLSSWGKLWFSQESLIKAEDLYTGRSFTSQKEIISDRKNTSLMIISAGAGLVSANDMIPSYEATFLKGKGPKSEDWHQLPKGGLDNLVLEKGDIVISFAPPKYHEALVHDPNINSIKGNLVVASTSPLASIASSVVDVHPRTKEVLAVASSDLNTELFRLYFTEGFEGFKRVSFEAENLPPKVKRRRVSDEELLDLVNSLNSINSLSKLVRYLRDDLKIKASVERISAARKLATGE